MNYKDLWLTHSHRINADDSEKYMDEEDFKIAILEWESAKTVSRVELPVILPSETLSCEQVRLDAIEECAKHLEQLAEKANDVLVEERHILQEDTVELFRNDIDHARKLANNLRELASKH